MNSPECALAIGIDLGGSSIKAVTVSADGAVIERQRKDFDVSAPLNWAEAIRNLVEHLVERLAGQHPDRAVCVGLAAPGLATSDGTAIAHMPGRLQGLEGLHWSRFLGRPDPVPVLNDAHAALLGEAWLGAARGLRNVILLTLGTGVGGAAIVDGRLLKGQIGRAGHLGHNCLDPRGPADVTGIPASIEYYIGNWNIQERTGGRFASTHEMIQALAAGDPVAQRTWALSVRALACTLATYINVLDPEAIIIGGGIARAGPALFGPLEAELRPVEWQPGGHTVRLLAAELGEFAGAMGAARQALNSFGEASAVGSRR